jgi:hypothetical protein
MTELDLQFKELQDYLENVTNQAENITDPTRQASIYELSKHLRNAITIINRQSCYISSIMTVRKMDDIRQDLEQENMRLKQLCTEHGVPLQDRFRKGVYTFN